RHFEDHSQRSEPGQRPAAWLPTKTSRCPSRRPRTTFPPASSPLTFPLMIARLHGSALHSAFARIFSSSSRNRIVHHEKLLASVYSSFLPVSCQQFPKGHSELFASLIVESNIDDVPA